MIQTFSFTEAGESSANEDAFIIQPHPDDPDCWLCMVADGQGGSGGGREAARLAVQTAMDRMGAYPPAQLALASTWGLILFEVDQAVFRSSEAGLTSLVCLALYREYVMGAASGDCAALVFSGPRHYNLTATQSGDPVGSGEVVCNAFSYPLQDPWKIVAMTDGVWKYAGWQHVFDYARETPGQELIDRLILKARLPGSGKFQDDFTVVVLESEA